jgi:hypothetical protein
MQKNECKSHNWDEYNTSYWHPYGFEFPKGVTITFECINCGKQANKFYHEKNEGTIKIE